jgi:transposase-like protein
LPIETTTYSFGEGRWLLICSAFRLRPMEVDLAPEGARPRDRLVRYTARGRHYSPAARLAIVEESYATGARVADTAALYGISRSQLHAWRKKYDGRDEAGDDCRELVSFAPVVIGEPVSEASASAVAEGGPGAGHVEIICPTGHRVVVGNDVDGMALRLVLDVLGR